MDLIMYTTKSLERKVFQGPSRTVRGQNPQVMDLEPILFGVGADFTLEHVFQPVVGYHFA